MFNSAGVFKKALKSLPNVSHHLDNMYLLYSTYLLEVGHLEAPRTANYETGQLFLHKLFGYRGVILLPWRAQVFDRDLIAVQFQNMEASVLGKDPQEAGKRSQTFYSVLVDSRDAASTMAQTDPVTFLSSSHSSRGVVTIPGLDYVEHSHILPYSTTEDPPLHHELFDKFLNYRPDANPPLSGQDTLGVWQRKNHFCLQVNKVHKQTTQNIRVTVIPFYIGQQLSLTSACYWWRYIICLENLGKLAVRLKKRHWRIFSLSGSLENVKGRGVIGQEPLLCQKMPAFQYSGHVSLEEPSGHMWGTYLMERDDGYFFECRIPSFCLESKLNEANAPKAEIE